MSNQEIRMKAWKLYRENFLGLIALGLCYSTLQKMVSTVCALFFAQSQTLCLLACWLLGSPLTLGAVLCLAHLWRTGDHLHYIDLVTFYRSLDSWVGSIILFLLQGLAALLPILLPVFVLNPSLMLLGVIVGVGLMFWLQLRIQMSSVLFVSEEDMSAWEAVRDSFFRMSGQVTELLCLIFSVQLVPIVFDVVLKWGLVGHEVLSAQSASLLLVVFALFYQPFAFAAVTGWVIEHLNDEEQPEEASGPPKNPLLRDIANDLAEKGGHQPGMQDKN